MRMLARLSFCMYYLLATTTEVAMAQPQTIQRRLRANGGRGMLRTLTDEYYAHQMRCCSVFRHRSTSLTRGFFICQTGNYRGPSPPPPPPPTAAPLVPPSTPAVKEVILSHFPSDTTVFDSSSSYQSLALTWAESTSNGDSPVMSRSRILQRFALACLYYATNNVSTPWTTALIMQEGAEGDSLFQQGDWWNSKGWLDADDECSWYGITCNNESGQVQSVDLSNNRLTGTLPPEIRLLQASLVELNLEKNMFYNENGIDFVGDLENLQVLLLAHNAILEDNGLPLSFQSLTKLRSLDISYCLFTGTIEEGFFNVFGATLEYLDLSGNTFEGPVPVSVANLWALKYLYISDNQFEGSLDPILKTTLPNLEEFWADDNEKLNAVIPPEIKNLSSLKSLSLVNCNLGGYIPKEIGNLVSMEQLWLSENKLNDKIPAELGSLTVLTVLHLEKNDSLTGSMPASVCSNVDEGNLATLGADTTVDCECCTCRGGECGLVRR